MKRTDSKGPGRPRRNPDEPADTYVRIRLTATEKEALEEVARAAGLSVSEWVRSKIPRRRG